VFLCITVSEDFGTMRVNASIYNLTTGSTNKLLRSFKSLGGIYHVGIELAGVEWSYGFSEKGSGVFAVEPRRCSLGPFHEQVFLGETTLRVDDVIRILHRLRLEWNGSDYNIMNFNCVVFSREFLREIIPGAQLPEYVSSLTDTASRVAGKSSITKLTNDNVFGTSEKELMWKEAELIMRDVERESLCISDNYRGVIHAVKHAAEAHSPLETRAVCARSLYRIQGQNKAAYMRSNVTRHIALHYR